MNLRNGINFSLGKSFFSGLPTTVFLLPNRLHYPTINSQTNTGNV
jgi:hypothetical protein